jgi:putative membrane protein
MKNRYLMIALVALVGCGANSEEKKSVVADSGTKAPDTLVGKMDNAVDLDTADVAFFRQAAYGGMIEVESSHKMVSVTLDSTVKRFAQMMVADHRAANEKLKALASSKGYSLPSALPQSKAAIVDKIETLKDEGRNEYYLKLMVEEHKTALAIFSKASRTKDQQIRNFATALLPTLEHHYEHIQKIYTAFQRPKADQGDDVLKLSDRKNQ